MPGEMTFSAALISRARKLVHDATARGEASEEIACLTTIANEYEIAVRQALAVEAAIHDLTKGMETII